jgi:type VI secretion system protein ImpK
MAANNVAIAPDAAPAAGPRGPNLALIFQELLTAIVRLRAGRQDVASAEVFRNQILGALKTVDQQAKAAAYVDEDIRLATYAMVAFLDESILNQRKPIFADWVRRPLQEEMFGKHVAGEQFFQNLTEVLGRRETPQTADVLEVYYLCLLLGYLGRYSISSKAELRSTMVQLEDKIRRIRRMGADLSPNWRLPQEGGGFFLLDPWIRRLTIGLGSLILLSILLFFAYKISLGGGAQSLRDLAPAGQR